MYQIIQRPYITEKTLSQAAKGYYTFVVSDLANKAQIADAVDKQYNVGVVGVRTMRMHGKVRRVGKRRTPVLSADWKKAVVTLKVGQKIDAFDVSSESPREPSGKEKK